MLIIIIIINFFKGGSLVSRASSSEGGGAVKKAPPPNEGEALGMRLQIEGEGNRDYACTALLIAVFIETRTMHQTA